MRVTYLSIYVGCTVISKWAEKRELFNRVGDSGLVSSNYIIG